MPTLSYLVKKNKIEMFTRRLDGGLLVNDFCVPALHNVTINLKDGLQSYFSKTVFSHVTFKGDLNVVFFRDCTFDNCTFQNISGNFRGSLNFNHCKFIGQVLFTEGRASLKFEHCSFDDQERAQLYMINFSSDVFKMEYSDVRAVIEMCHFRDFTAYWGKFDIDFALTSIKRLDTEEMTLYLRLESVTIGYWTATGKIKSFKGSNFAICMTKIHSETCKYPEYMTEMYRVAPKDGGFVAYKKVFIDQNTPAIVGLEVPASAERSNGLTRGIRLSQAMPFCFYNMDGEVLNVSEGRSKVYLFDPISYKIGVMTYPNTFSPEPLVSDAPGIHAYLNFYEAVNF